MWVGFSPVATILAVCSSMPMEIGLIRHHDVERIVRKLFNYGELLLSELHSSGTLLRRQQLHVLQLVGMELQILLQDILDAGSRKMWDGVRCSAS
jgi:hypothetical protein